MHEFNAMTLEQCIYQDKTTWKILRYLISRLYDFGIFASLFLLFDSVDGLINIFITFIYLGECGTSNLEINISIILWQKKQPN